MAKSIPTNCKDCGAILTENMILKRKCRCETCQGIYNRKTENKRNLLKNLEKYKDRTDMLTCKECGWKVEQTGNLHQHIKMHGLTVDSYCKKFNCNNDALLGTEYVKNLSNRVSGENNPAYQHNGKFSALSNNFIKYNDLNDTDKESQIKNVSKKISKSNKENGNTTSTLNYWLKQGYSPDEAKEKLSERQRTFTLEKCIEKYGEVEGKKRWEERQKKWLESLPHSNYSMISQELFFNIFEKLDKSLLGSVYFAKLSNKEYRLGTIKIDFFIEKLNFGIEFLGDYWHANPKLYKENNVINGLKAKEIWLRDYTRKKYISDNFKTDIYYIWESDYKQDKNKTIQEILTKIEEKIKCLQI